MEILYEKLPKDLVNIIEEYAKDRTNYDKVISALTFNILIFRNHNYMLKKRVFNCQCCYCHYCNKNLLLYLKGKTELKWALQ